MKEAIVGSRDFYLQFERYGGIDMLEEIQDHPNPHIYQLASDIIVQYGEGEKVIPSVNYNIAETGKLAF